MVFLRKINVFILPMLTFFIGGCATMEKIVHKEKEPMVAVFHEKDSNNSSGYKEIDKFSGKNLIKADHLPASLKPYKKDFENKGRNSKASKIFLDDEQVTISVDNIKVSAFIKYIFSEVFNKNFVIDPEISKEKLNEPITLKLTDSITKARLYEVVLKILEKYGITIETDKNIFFIKKADKNAGAAFSFGNQPENVKASSGTITHFVPIEYASATNIYSFISRVSGSNVSISAEENILVLKGTYGQVMKSVEIISQLDQPAMRAQHIGTSKLEYIDAVYCSKKINELLSQEGIPVALSAGQNGVLIKPLEKRGLMIYFAANEKWIKRVEYWISILDMPSEKGENNYFLYFPKNSRASTIADSISAIMGKRLDSFDEEDNNRSKKNKGIKSAVFRDFSLSVDKERNALIIFSSPKKYQQLKKLINQLDIMPPQVLIEASIIEVTLTDQLNYGLEWFLKSDSVGDSTIFKTKGGLGIGKGGFDFSFVASGGDFQAVINAMMKDDLVKIHSNPRITVRDGKDASFVVGTEVPVITSESESSDSVTDGNTNTVRSVEYRTTGLTLNVTPYVHSKGVVTLEISQALSEAQLNKTSSISSPVILKRSVDTEVVVTDGQTIVLGGLIKENNSETEVKIPILGDIPFIGHLFKTTSKGTNRTELIIIITPRIIRNSSQADDVRDIIFESFQGINYIKKSSVNKID